MVMVMVLGGYSTAVAGSLPLMEMRRKCVHWARAVQASVTSSHASRQLAVYATRRVCVTVC